MTNPSLEELTEIRDMVAGAIDAKVDVGLVVYLYCRKRKLRKPYAARDALFEVMYDEKRDE